MKILNYTLSLFLIILTFETQVLSRPASYEYGIKSLSTQVAIVVGGNGLIMKTTDGGVTWLDQNSGTTNVLYSNDYLNEQNGVCVGINGVILKTTDGVNWNAKTSNTTNDLTCIKYISTTTILTCGLNGTILKSTDAGETWTVKTSSVTNNLNSLEVVGNKCFAVGNNATLIVSNDSGENWSSVNINIGTQKLNSISMRNANNGSIAGDNGLIMTTFDGGNTWLGNNGPTFTSNFNSVKYLDDTTAVAVGTLGEIIRTTDGGLTWFATNSVTDYDIYAVNFANISKGISVGQDGTTLYTSDGGVTWSANAQTYATKFKNQKAPNSRKTTTNKSFEISQNFPNPFNPTTMISYTLLFDSKISVKVYDITGREVSTLINNYQQAGTYTLSFNASNLTSGVYFYKIFAQSGKNEFSKTMRMILLK